MLLGILEFVSIVGMSVSIGMSIYVDSDDRRPQWFQAAGIFAIAAIFAFKD